MNSQPAPKLGACQDIAFECLCLMLRPLAAFCVRHSLRLPEILEAFKLMLIRSSEELARDEGGAVSVSRVSVMTGITRREIVRLRKSEPHGIREPLSIVTKVVGKWLADETCQDKDGAPRPLTLDGNESEFHRLVKSVSNDLNAYTVYFELERNAQIKRDESNRVQLIRHAFEPRHDLKEGIKMLASDTTDLMAAIEENLAHPDKAVPHLHVTTEYDNLISEALPMLKKWVVEQGAKFHEKVRKHLEKFDRDLNPELRDRPGGGRIAVGSFSFTEEDRR